MTLSIDKDDNKTYIYIDIQVHMTLSICKEIKTTYVQVQMTLSIYIDQHLTCADELQGQRLLIVSRRNK